MRVTSTGSTAPDTTWSDLSSLEDAARQREMVERFRQLTGLEDTARLDKLEAMARAEYALPDADLHHFTASRLRAWIELDHTDPGQAQLLASAYDRVFQRVPAELAMRRAMLVQSVARSELSAEEVAELDKMAPTLMQAVPHATTMSGIREREATPEQRAKPWWKFW
jgi:hypothetical protein